MDTGVLSEGVDEPQQIKFRSRPMLLLAICPYLNTRTQKKKNEKKNPIRGFVIPVSKLAHPEIFSSIERFIKPGDFLGSSPFLGFPNFP